MVGRGFDPVDNERGDRLPGERVGNACDTRLTHGGVGDERRLDFDGREAVPRHVYDVVETPENPDVAIGVNGGAVTRDVVCAVLADTGVGGPVRVAVTLGVAPHGAGHAGPRAARHERARAAGGNLVALIVNHGHIDAGEGHRGRPGLERRDAGQGHNHGGAGFRLPPRVNHRSLIAAEVTTEPHPRLGVNRLADGAEQANARQVVARCSVVMRQLVTEPGHEAADQGGRRVIDGDAVALDDFKVTRTMRRIGGALVDHLGEAV